MQALAFLSFRHTPQAVPYLGRGNICYSPISCPPFRPTPTYPLPPGARSQPGRNGQAGMAHQVAVSSAARYCNSIEAMRRPRRAESREARFSYASVLLLTAVLPAASVGVGGLRRRFRSQRVIVGKIWAFLDELSRRTGPCNKGLPL